MLRYICQLLVLKCVFIIFIIVLYNNNYYFFLNLESILEAYLILLGKLLYRKQKYP